MKTKGRNSVTCVNSAIKFDGNFDLKVEVLSHNFKVFFNGEHVCSYDLPTRVKTTISTAENIRIDFDPSNVTVNMMALSEVKSAGREIYSN